MLSIFQRLHLQQQLLGDSSESSGAVTRSGAGEGDAARAALLGEAFLAPGVQTSDLTDEELDDLASDLAALLLRSAGASGGGRRREGSSGGQMGLKEDGAAVAGGAPGSGHQREGDEEEEEEIEEEEDEEAARERAAAEAALTRAGALLSKETLKRLINAVSWTEGLLGQGGVCGAAAALRSSCVLLMRSSVAFASCMLGLCTLYCCSFPVLRRLQHPPISYFIHEVGLREPGELPLPLHYRPSPT